MQLFHRIFGHHRVTYQVKEQQMTASRFTQHLGNIFTHHIQTFLFFYEVSKIIQLQSYIKMNSFEKENKNKKQKTIVEDISIIQVFKWKFRYL